jgi:hypothetical protein
MDKPRECTGILLRCRPARGAEGPGNRRQHKKRYDPPRQIPYDAKARILWAVIHPYPAKSDYAVVACVSRIRSRYWLTGHTMLDLMP